MTLKAPKPQSQKYPKELNALGDHIRKRRLELGLFQKQVATQIGVSEATMWNWERHESLRRIDVLPQVIMFLGYDPFPPAGSIGEKLILARRQMGLTQKAMAKRIGIAPGTLGMLEKGLCKRPFPETVRKVGRFIRNA